MKTLSDKKWITYLFVTEAMEEKDEESLQRVKQSKQVLKDQQVFVDDHQPKGPGKAEKWQQQ